MQYVYYSICIRDTYIYIVESFTAKIFITLQPIFIFWEGHSRPPPFMIFPDTAVATHIFVKNIYMYRIYNTSFYVRGRA